MVFVEVMFDALLGESSSCVVMFAPRLSEYCEASCSAWSVRASILAEVAC